MFKYIKFFGPNSLDPKFFNKSYNTTLTSSNLIPFEVNKKVYYLPNNPLYYLWGKVIYKDRDILIIKSSDGRIFKVVNRGDNFLVTCVINGIVVLEFSDYTSHYFDSRLHYFEREIGDYIYELENHIIV